MALQNFHKTYYKEKAKKYGVPERHPLLQRIKRGDERAAKELDKFFQNTSESLQPYDAHRNTDIGANKYGIEAVKGFSEPEGSFLWGKPEWREQIALNSPEQQQYINNSLSSASEQLPELYQEWGNRSNRGVLDELFGNNTSKGFQGLIGKLGGLGEYLPSALASGAGSALTGGGLGGILQALIGSAAGQYVKKSADQSPMFNNMSSGMSNYYNQGMSGLSDLYNNRGQYRR